MNTDDLWTIKDPPWWIMGMDGIVATAAESITLCIALPPDQTVLEMCHLPPAPGDFAESLVKLETVRFYIDRENHRLVQIGRKP